MPFTAEYTKEQQEEIKAYNTMLKEIRKTELPPVSEPLLLNCELLFALAGELAIDSTEQARIDKMLHGNGDNLFLTGSIDNQFRFDGTAIDSAAMTVAFDGKELTLPASLVSGNTVLRVEVIDATGTVTVFDDWTVSKVDRKTEGSIETFSATYISASAKEYEYKPEASISIDVYTSEESIDAAASFAYTTRPLFMKC